MIEFPYRKVLSDEYGIIYIPIAIVELKNRDKRVRCEMLIDSGADITLIPKSVGEYLGLAIERMDVIKELRGIGESIIPYITKGVELKIGEERFNARIGWALVEGVPLLLGRLDIFDRFDIKFLCKEKMVVFESGKEVMKNVRG